MNNKIEFTVDGEIISAKRGVTIIDALISAGESVVGKVGCKGGVCGACLCLIERSGGKPEYALACRTLAEDGLKVFFVKPSPKKVKYDFLSIKPEGNILIQLYPEINGCISCGKCNERCVKGIDVLSVVRSAREGDYKKVADLSYNCIECGACSNGCPSKINQAEVSLLARRIYAKFL